MAFLVTFVPHVDAQAQFFVRQYTYPFITMGARPFRRFLFKVLIKNLAEV